MNAARRPVLGALAVVLRADEVLLVRRANAPDQGLWGFPGGKVEWGESIKEAAARELLEETGVRARPSAVIGSTDFIQRGADGEVQYHMYLVGVSCIWQGGAPKAGDDALEARWIPVEDVHAGHFEMSDGVAYLLGLAEAARR